MHNKSEMERRASPPADVEVFYRQEWPRVIKSLFLFCGDMGVAEELAQETFIKVFADWKTVREMVHPEGWVHRIAINLARSHYRKKQAERRARRKLAQLDTDTTLPEPSLLAIDLASAVSSLPQRQRVALLLRHYLGFSVSETSALVGYSERTVKRLTERAIEKLRSSSNLQELAEVRNGS